MLTTGKSISFAVMLCVAWSNLAWGVETSGLCPAQNIITTIEFLDKPFSHTGYTCGFANTEKSYTSGTCKNPLVDYSGQDVIYKVVLHEGNSAVDFKLSAMTGRTDLTMALVSTCGNGNSCVNSSIDRTGSLDEHIGPSSYTPPGTYYLYIDSTQTKFCGSYTLTVTGFNPTPDLLLDLSTDTNPTAGEDLTYKISIRNQGKLTAHNVKITHTLPSGIERVRSTGCTRSGISLTCTIPFLAPDQAMNLPVTVFVMPNTRESLKSSVDVIMDENDPTPNNKKNLDSKVQTRIDLSIKHDFPATTIAGNPTLYTLKLPNTGSSDATAVEVTDKLPLTLSFTAIPAGCMPQENGVFCKIPRIKAHSNDTKLSFTVKSKSSAFGRIFHTPSAQAAELKGTTFSTTINTDALRLANLAIILAKPNDSTQAAGNPLSYQITVKNNGPSDSAGATITDLLLPGVTFTSGKPNCKPTATANGTLVTCNTLALKAGESSPVALDVLIEPWLTPMTLVNSATVKAKDNASDPIITSNSVETRVLVRADMLAQIQKVERIPWTLPPTSGNVKAGENLLYTVRIANNGPSDFRGGFLQDDLTEVGLDFVSSPDGCSSTDNKVNCPVPGRKKGEDIVRRFVVRIPPSRAKKIDNRICIKSNTAEHDSNPGNDCADTSTSPEKEADLSVTLSDSPDAVLPGGDLTYMLSVKNEGPSDATAVAVELFHPPADTAESRTEFDDVAAGATESHSITVSAPEELGKVVRTAKVQSDTSDLNQPNDSAEVTTTVATMDDADLVLTKTAGAEAAVAGRLLSYTLALANHGFHRTGEAALTVEDPLDEAASFEPSQSSAECTDIGDTVNCTFPPLDPGQSETRTLTVHVGTTGSLSNTANVLQADAEAVHDPNPDNNQASAEVPVVQPPTDTELCASWSVRFLRGQPADTSTDLLFFVPGNAGGVVASGRVFTESGAFVQNVSVESDKKVFQRSTFPLLAGSGSIEWTFREGLVGSMTAVHKRAGDEVAIPGFCRRPGHTGARSLVLPLFQVDSAINTYVAVRNETDDDVDIRITYSGVSGEYEQRTITLAGHGVSILNLRKELGSGRGSLEIETLSLSEGQPVEALSGDFIQVGPDGLAGSALERKPD